MVKYPLMKLPDLEAKCPACKGVGSVYEGNEDCFADCAKCNGSGFVPTADGKRIIALFRHQFRVTVTPEFSFPAVR